MITAQQLISRFQLMYNEHWRYEWGKHEKGCVDCSGAFKYAFSQYGISYPNGSNAIARKLTVRELLPVSKAEPGMAAFKAKTLGEPRYDLPDKYRAGGSEYNGDLNDYYHIGLVDDDPKYVLNAKGKDYGFSRDPLNGKHGWDYVAYLKYVDYGSEKQEEKRMQAKVVLPVGATGSTVNMRTSPSTKSAIVDRIPVGSVVDVAFDIGLWSQIEFNGHEGYTMSDYLEYVENADETDSLSKIDISRIDQALKSLEECVATIQKQIDAIGSIVGRG